MAPNRKKKKPSSNPARGFATTSTISKSKIVDNEIADEIAETVDADPEPKTVAPENPAREGTGQKELHELSPDQLEARLEESELQLLVEKHGEKVKKDAARQVLRLQTERRLIRSQAFQLATSRWLPEELLQLIFNHLEQEKKLEALPPPLDPSNNANTYSKAMTADELSIRLWALRQALIDLGFMQPRVEDALDHLVQIGRSIDRANSSAGKEGLWGVEDCLDWLAMSCTLDELPDYETHRTEAVEKLLRESVSSFPTFDFDTRDPSLLLSDIEIPAESVSALDDQDQKQNERSTSSDSLDRDQEIADDDLEPHEILDRYLSLKARLHERRPDLTEPKTPKSKGKGSKNKLIPSQTPDRAVDPDSSRLMKRIRKIERDILFDLEDAQEKWSIMRVKLLKDAADRKKLGIDDEPSIPEASAASLSAPNLNPTGTVSDEDSALDLGDFFASLPEEKTDAAAGRSGMTITAADGTSMSVRDFGQWSGLGPRRVFEEACRARDSLSRVIYSSVSSSSFSCRHSILVRWSRAQELIPTTMICGVTCHADSRNVSIEMVGVSTPDLVQSEAFVSTASLFIIFAGKPKEEKAYLRLPATWRDLWDELVNLRNEEVAALDRERLREIRKMVQAAENKRQREEVSTPNPNGHVEALSSNGSKLMPSIGVEYVNAEDMVKLWTSRTSTPMYINMLKSRMTLPIWKFKSELLDAIEDHQVTIVCGETGCGKSTQVPAYILERELLSGRDCKIYCTEPRRISAISLARRVSEELGEGKNDVGTTRSLVGYAIRLESQVTSQTRLVYATTGIVMRMLESGNQLEEVTHLVLDEVHERTIDSDFLLIVLRKLMIRRPGLKVILMSATVNAEQFSRYLGGAPILNVPGRTFPVQTKYLEDAIEVTNYGNMKLGWSRALEEEDEDVDASAGTGAKMDLTGYSTQTRNTLAEFNEYRIDYDLIVRLLETISRNQVYAEYSKAILVFLPGIAEIRTLNDMLVGHPAFASHNWYVYPLHSTIATEDQERAFLVPPKGIRKIVLATNIAETGITIPDVTSVIDTGKHKEMRFDERRQLSRLLESFISRANAKQRRGRAGRVQNGLCFHLFTRERHDNLMSEQQTPEMLRLSLQDLVLRVKICKLGSIEETLSEAIDPPLAKNIRRAIDSLIDVKALTPGEDLTPLGRQLAKLPLDVFLGKLILLGSLFGCLDAALTIAAVLSSKSPFAAPMGARAQADLARLGFKKGDSDLQTVYNAYCAWKRVCSSTGSSEYQFCRKYFLSPQTLSSIEDLKTQLTTSMVDAGFLTLDDAGRASLNRARFSPKQRHFVEIPPSYDSNGGSELVINSVIAWSFYPKLLVRDGKGWRNVANNQSISLYPTSVNKGVSNPPKWISFYHIMQSSSKFYNAHDTSAVEDFAIALVCGEADFKMYSGVVVIDGNRMRFSVDNWKVMLALKILRLRVREIMTQSFRYPGKALSTQQQGWLAIWQKTFS